MDGIRVAIFSHIFFRLSIKIFIIFTDFNHHAAPGTVTNDVINYATRRILIPTDNILVPLLRVSLTQKYGFISRF